MPGLPGWQQGRERRVQTKEAIQIHRPQPGLGLKIIRPWDSQAWPLLVVDRISVRNHYVQSIGRTPQKDTDQDVTARGRLGWGKGQTGQPLRPGGQDW